MKNSDLLTTTQKDRLSNTNPTKTEDEFRCSGRVSSFCSTCCTHRDSRKGVIKICKSKKNGQHNDQKKKYKRTNNDLQNIHIKNEWHEPHLATSHCFPDLMKLEQRVYSDCRSHNIFHLSSAMNCQSNTSDATSWAENTRSPPCVSGIRVVHFVKF